jgi:hypothetical protein
MKDLNAADQAAAFLFSSLDFIFVMPGLVLPCAGHPRLPS